MTNPGMLSYEHEMELISAKNAERNQFRAWVDRHDELVAHRLTRWAKAAPWIPRTVLVPLAREGVEPDSDAGMQTIYHSSQFARKPVGPRGIQRPTGPVGPQGPQGPAPTHEESGFFGDIGSAIGTAARGVGHAAGFVGDQLDFNSQMQHASGEQLGIPDVNVPLKTTSRYVTAGLQTGAEALDTALSRPWTGSPAFENQIRHGTVPTEQPFSLKQFTLYQMLHGEQSGAGFFPSGQALEKASAEQRKVRGTVDGHAATPGRLAASAFVEPGTRPFQILSGAIDATIDWKLDPAAVALTKIGDVREARKIFDTYGAVSGVRARLHGPTAVAWLESEKADRFAAAVANTSSITELMRRTKGQWPAELYAAATEARTPEAVKALLRPVLGGEIRDVPKWGYDFKSVLSDSRWANQMPRGAIDIEDKDNAIQQVERLLVTGKVDRKTIDRVVMRVAKAEDRPQMFDAVVHGAGGALSDSLQYEYGLSRRDAKKLTTFFQDSLDNDRQFFVDSVGDTPHVPGMQLDGDAVPIVGPHIPSELLNRAIPLPDARELRRAASKLRPMLELPGVAQSQTLLDFFTDSIFKVGALLRFAWPVRVISEEQIRQGTAGLDSAFRHPASWIGWVVGKKGNVDIADIPFDQLDDSKYFEAMSRGATFRGPPAGGAAEVDKVYSKHFVPVRQEADEFPRAWADELSHLHLDDVTRTVAKNARTGDGIATTKAAFWDGHLKKYRDEMISSGGWRGNLTEKEWSDAYIDSVWDRVRQTTNDNSELIDAIADGSDMRKGMRLNNNFVKKLEGLADDGNAPEVVKGRLAVSVKGSTAGKVADGYNRAVDRMFTFLMSKPTNYLSRSPAFKQFYWERVGEIYGDLAPDVQRQVSQVARGAKLDRSVLKRFGRAARSGELDLESADTIAKAHALDSTKKLLYDVSERSHFFDAARIVFPFGEAWKEVLGVWSKLAVDQPQTIRKFQQVVGGARGSGFFYTDPQDGNEYYTFPFSEAITKKVAGVPFPMRGLVSGLNIIGQGLPGIGPAVQIPVAHLIPDEPQYDAIREIVSPYGTPEAWSAFLPGWAQKLQQGDWLAPALLPQTPNQERIFENTVKDVMGYLVSTGAYDPTDPDDLARLTADAKDKSKRLYALRGAAQFVAPSAPAYVPKVEAKNGKMYEVWRLAKDYRDLQDADFESATQEFIDRYGEKAFLAANPKTQQQVYMPATTKQQKWWESANRQFVDAYPHVAGFFAPGSGDFDYNAYLRALDGGKIEQLSPREWLEAANHRLAGQIYANKRAMVGNNPSDEQASWLRDWKQELLDKYPGYDPDGAHGKNISPEKAMIELRQAVDEPDVKNTMLSKSIREYFDYRDQALAAANKAGFATLDSDKLRPLRDWLRDWGDELSHRTPAFQPVWDRLLYGELRLENEADGSQ